MVANQYYSFARSFSTFMVVLILGGAAQASTSSASAGAAARRLAQDLGAGAFPVTQLIVKYKNPAQLYGFEAGLADPALAERAKSEALQRLSQAAGVPLGFVREMAGEAFVLSLPEPLDAAGALALSSQLAALPEVEYAEPDWVLQPALTPNDPSYASQWHYFAPGPGAYGINAPAAWDISTGKTSVVVAVIDNGLVSHADLAGRTLPGYDLISQPERANDGDGRDSDASDPGDWVPASFCFPGSDYQKSSWHGTHVAGTVGAASNNATGVAGVNWTSKILPVRVLGRCGGLTSDIIDGLYWAAGLSVTGVPANPNKARVLNLSISGTLPYPCSTSMQNAVNAARAAGSVVVVAAGNTNSDASLYAPGNCSGVITVGATSRYGSRAAYSNYGSAIEISAPGGDFYVDSGILSTSNTGLQEPGADAYYFYQGTSMAAPQVSGAASLLLSVDPTLTPDQVLQKLQNSVTSFPSGSTCSTSNCGAGILNIGKALQGYGSTVAYSLFIKVPVLTNGHFELGKLGWTESSLLGYPIIMSGAVFPGGVVPHSGSYLAWLGGANSETSTIQRNLTIFAGMPYLSYYYWIISAEDSNCVNDKAEIKINNVTVQTHGLCVANNTGAWVKGSVNLGAYLGKAVTLQFKTTSNADKVSNFFLDDLVFSATAGLPEVTVPADGGSPVVPSKDDFPLTSEVLATPEVSIEP